MTAAMIRSCNRCKKQFIKDSGCNKMTCPSCHNMQCYCCSQTLKDYDHFDQAPLGSSRRNGKKCPLYDDVEVRHEREVKEAEEAAKKQLMEENPDLDAEDLEIKISDRVKKTDAEKVQQQRAGPAGLWPAAIPPEGLVLGGDGLGPDMPFENLQGLGRAPWLNGRGGNGIGRWPREPREPLRGLGHAPAAGQPAQMVEPAVQALLPPHYGRMGNAPAPAGNAADEELAAFAFGHIRPHVRGVLDNAPAPAGNAADEDLAAFAFEHIHHQPHVRDAAQAPQAHAQAMQQQQRPETPPAAQLAYDRARREQLLHQIGQRLQMPEEFLAAPPPPNPAPPRDHPPLVPDRLGRNRVQADDEEDQEQALRAQREVIQAHIRRQQMRLRMQFEQIQQLGQLQR